MDFQETAGTLLRLSHKGVQEKWETPGGEELEGQQQDQQPDEQKWRQCKKQPEAEEDKDGQE